MNPLISIVTITYNSEKYLQNTIDSVASQKYPHIEYIIIDGQSTDSTLSIIKQNADKITYWVSEKDNGIADAMNKGLQKVTGDYVLFLHSDDYLVNGTSIANAVKRLDGEYDIYAFSIFFQTREKMSLKRSPSWDFRFNLKTKLLHQGVLCKKELFNKLGDFDTHFKIAMDYDFFLRAYRNKCKVKLIKNQTLSVMRDTGVSSRLDWSTLQKRLEEEKKVHKKNCIDSILLHSAYKFYWLLYFPYKKIFTSLYSNPR